MNEWMKLCIYIQLEDFVEHIGVRLCVLLPSNFMNAFSPVEERPIVIYRWFEAAGLAWCHSGKDWLSLSIS